jgi:hypothetical protein
MKHIITDHVNVHWNTIMYTHSQIKMYNFYLYIPYHQVLSSAARTLGSQVRILLGAWMCVCVCVFVLSCVGRGLDAGLIPRPRSPTKCLKDP